MIWFIRWIIGDPFRKTDGCDESDLALVRELADLLDARELAAGNLARREDLAC